MGAVRDRRIPAYIVLANQADKRADRDRAHRYLALALALNDTSGSAGSGAGHWGAEVETNLVLGRLQAGHAEVLTA